MPRSAPPLLLLLVAVLLLTSPVSAKKSSRGKSGSSSSGSSAAKKAAAAAAAAAAAKAAKKKKKKSSSSGDEEPLETDEFGNVVEPDEANLLSCFPAAATVQLASGATVRMDALAVGDSVLVSRGEYSPVYAFTHRDAAASTRHVELALSSGGTLTASAGHYIYANGHLRPMRAVAVGDVLETGAGGAATVTRIASITAPGLYNPQTLHGDVVVDGVRASTYTEALAPDVAHAALAPVRALWRWCGVALGSLEAGGGMAGGVSFAPLLPRGAQAY